MELAYQILIVLAVIYVPIWVWVWRNPERAERYHLCKYGPCIMIKTQLGMRTMDRLSRYTRFWRAFGFFSKVVSAVLFLMMMYMMVVALMAVPARMASESSIGIEYALAIPGLNPMLPLVYGVIALVVAMVVHELGHGIQARANGARVDSSGLLYGVVPLGAFVEPNEEDMSKKSRRARMARSQANSLVSYCRISCWAAARRRCSASSGVSPGCGPSAGGADAPGCSLISSVVNASTPSKQRSFRRALRASRAHAPHARSMHKSRSFFSRRCAAKSRSISSVIAASSYLSCILSYLRLFRMASSSS